MTAYFVDPAFPDRLRERVSQGCVVAVPAGLTPVERHSFTGPSSSVQRSAKLLASLLTIGAHVPSLRMELEVSRSLARERSAPRCSGWPGTATRPNDSAAHVALKGPRRSRTLCASCIQQGSWPLRWRKLSIAARKPASRDTVGCQLKSARPREMSGLRRAGKRSRLAAGPDWIRRCRPRHLARSPMSRAGSDDCQIQDI